MTELNKSRIKKMRNQPAESICDFSKNLEINYCCNLPLTDSTQFMLNLFLTQEFKQWEIDAVGKLRKQGKRFELTRQFNGITVTAIGKRI